MSDSMKLSTDAPLIAANKVQGVSVFNPAGEKLGTVKDIYIDKQSGHAEFAALAFGGALGVGQRYYPLPWAALGYDTEKHGFVVGIDRQALEAGPAYDDEELGDEDFAWRDEVSSYYDGMPF